MDHTRGITGIPRGVVIQPGNNDLKTPWMGGPVVMIKSISQIEMDQFLPCRFHIDRFIGAEAEWFSDRVGNIIGTIAEGTTKKPWGYAILRRDDGGRYRFWDMETSIESCDAARAQITRTMEATRKNDQDTSRVLG